MQAPTHEDCFSTHHLTQDSTNAAWGLAFLYVWPCRVKAVMVMHFPKGESYNRWGSPQGIMTCHIFSKMLCGNFHLSRVQ